MRAVAQDAVQDAGNSYPLSGSVHRSGNQDSGIEYCRGINRSRRSPFTNCNDLALGGNTHKTCTRLESPSTKKEGR